MVGLQHELGWLLQLGTLRTKEVLSVVRRGPEREGAVIVVIIDLGNAGIVLDREAVGIAGNVAGLTGCQIRNPVEVGLTESLPERPVLRKEDVAGHLEDHETHREDIGRLVDLAGEDLRGKVRAIPFSIDAFGRRPRGGKSEVADLEVAVKGDEDIGRLDVEMDEIGLVDCGETLHVHVSK